VRRLRRWASPARENVGRFRGFVLEALRAVKIDLDVYDFYLEDVMFRLG